EIGAGSDPGVYLLDGETDDDLRTAARDFFGSARLRLAAGTAGFAEYLAELADLPRAVRSRWPPVNSCLVVSGSMHDVSRQQIQHAKDVGWSSFRPEELLASISPPTWCLVDTGAPVGMAGPLLATRTGATVRDLLRHIDFDAATVFGGDTAFGIVSALGGPPLYPLGEVLPGVPVSSIRAASLGSEIPGRGRDLCFISKAGGFGPIGLLTLLRKALECC
ncbi:MAG: hypothetical protein HXY20_09095, partial [Acidobacteria bacterium]|nr:hypothetical protein [Acidobacteriota bacterium]